MIHTFTSVGPSKLDLLLAELHPQPLSSEKRTKVCLLTDIIRLIKLLDQKKGVTPAWFYKAYELSIEELEQMQHCLQVDYNTSQYRNTIQGADF